MLEKLNIHSYHSFSLLTHNAVDVLGVCVCRGCEREKRMSFFSRLQTAIDEEPDAQQFLTMRVFNTTILTRFRSAKSSQGVANTNDFLLVTTIVLGILDVVLIFIIIFGYCKYVRRKEDQDRIKLIETVVQEKRKSVADLHPRGLDPVAEEQETPAVSLPAKMRKRSMTFTETDEECRKYREGLANSYAAGETTKGSESDRPSRKKSVVTFVGVE
ncbi:hypothetical protein RUM43_001595 [Polyplax serrata]|uniref:Uncharacterized protein n=1 Tax=Polyplax serrata TaxID=468196 RepID=A0AAN8SFN6_POLSC